MSRRRRAGDTRPPGRRPGTAPGGPGSESYFDLARKDCVGTARNTTSKVWFTVADGVLSDVYWPTVDATNVHTLQYLVTDGHSFTDLQTRDMTYRWCPTRPGCGARSSPRDAAHGYRITTTYIADPARDAVLMRTRSTGRAATSCTCGSTRWPAAPAAAARRTPAATARCSTPARRPVPVAFNTNTTTNAVNRNYAVPTYEALESSNGFSQRERRLRRHAPATG